MRGMPAVSVLAFAFAASLSAAVQDPAAAPPTAETGPSSAPYPIGPNDVVRVTVYDHPDLSPTVVVEPDGSFVFPLLGRVEARGLTPRELEQVLVRRLGDGFVRHPQVAVVVQTYRSHVVYVMGEITRPGSVPLPDARTLVEVLARAGPLLPAAGAEVIVLRPRAGGETEVIHVSLAQLQAGRLENNNVALQPGDTVLVPRAARVFVSGGVKKPGAYAITPELTVRQAISLAGGFAEHASRRGVHIVRVVDGRRAQVKVALDDPLLPDDTVVVGEGR